MLLPHKGPHEVKSIFEQTELWMDRKVFPRLTTKLVYKTSHTYYPKDNMNIQYS